MSRVAVSILIAVLLSPCVSIAGSEMDLERLTAECIAASNGFREIRHDFAYKVLHSVHYTGWSGDANHPALTFAVAMDIRWAGSDKQGRYWFLDRPQPKHAVRVTSDADGNIRMLETDANGRPARLFRGTMRDGVIKGVWEDASGGKRFGFYLKPAEN